MIKLINQAFKISLKKITVYRFETIMLFINVAFNFAFILVFWSGVNNSFALPNNYSNQDVLLFSGVCMISSAINQIFFGVNVLPYIINSGDLDTYLIRPQNLSFLYIIDNINIVEIISELLLAFTFLTVLIPGNYNLKLTNVLISLLLLIVGNLVMVIVSAIISMLSFWFGVTDDLRNVLNSFEDLKKYPMGIFSAGIRRIFTYLFPISLITYYPFEILIERMSLDFSIVFTYVLVFIAFFLIFSIVKKKGLAKYESNN